MSSWREQSAHPLDFVFHHTIFNTRNVCCVTAWERLQLYVDIPKVFLLPYTLTKLRQSFNNAQLANANWVELLNQWENGKCITAFRLRVKYGSSIILLFGLLTTTPYSYLPLSMRGLRNLAPFNPYVINHMGINLAITPGRECILILQSLTNVVLFVYFPRACD